MITKKLVTRENKYLQVHKSECPQCKSTNTYYRNKLVLFSTTFSILSFLTLCISLWIPILAWVVAPVLMCFCFVGILATILFLGSRNYSFICKNCGLKYKINKKEYKKITNK